MEYSEDLSSIRKDVEIELLKRKLNVGKLEVYEENGEVKGKAERVYRRNIMKDIVEEIEIPIIVKAEGR